GVVSSLIGTIGVTVLCAYLTTFRLIQQRDTNTIILSSSLFYFNPVLIHGNSGVLPDIYVALAGTLILILWKQTLNGENRRKAVASSILIAFVAFAGLFFKETALIFIPFVCLLGILEKKRNAIK